MIVWKKSSYSPNGNHNCVEISNTGRVRDSKNPTGPSFSAQGLITLATRYAVQER